jgi:DNA-binding response OmpR family regulator
VTPASAWRRTEPAAHPRNGDAARALGLETGIDNYLVKPFASGELLARVCSLLHRCQTEAPSTLRYGDL